MNKKKTTEDFITHSKKIHGEKYDYSVVKYVNNHTKVKINCPYHGFFEIRPNDHLSKSVGCNKCNNSGISKSQNVGNKIINRFNHKHNFKYDYSLVEYKGFEKKIKIICPKHGIFEQTPHHHVNGRGCQKCGKTEKLTNSEFILRAKKINNNKYDYSLVDYKNYNTKVKVVCESHGIFEVRPHDHLTKKSGCPICNDSKGKKIIRNFLTENGIAFTQQKRFKECKDKRTLPFDFYLESLNICIEFDGEQHFLNRKTFGGDNRFEDIKRKDKIKTKFCKEKNIKLIRINYKDVIIDVLKMINE